MKLNIWIQRFLMVRNWVAKALLSLAVFLVLWQGGFYSSSSAIAAPSTLIATSTTHQVKGAADEVRDRSKDLIQETKKNVERTASRNAAKVDQGDDEGGFFERRAQRDQARIQQRAEEDASRTEKAVDDSMNAVKGVADRVKDAFRG